MNKRIVLALALALWPAAASADDTAALYKEEAVADPLSLEPTRLRDSMYSVSSDELDAAESLNRVSGHIDLGFAGPSQVYSSNSHYKPSPFGREKSAESIPS